MRRFRALRSLTSATPSRTEALLAAAFDDDPIDVARVDEPEWVRVVAVGRGRTLVSTSLPFPDDSFELLQGGDAILRADQDFLLEADQPVAVLQALPSQGVTGIPRQFPGGDPAIIAVPPIQQYRQDYIFLTPDKYAFDFVVITADREADILLDGEPLPEPARVLATITVPAAVPSDFQSSVPLVPSLAEK